MEKRLPLAIILSILVLVGYQALLAPPPRPDAGVDGPVRGGIGAAADETAPTGGSAANGGGDAPSAAAGDAPGMGASQGPTALIAAEAEREIVIELGVRGEPGHFLARFTNRGAQLLDLRTGTYHRRVGLSDAERDDPANWLRLIEPVDPLRPTGPVGTFVLDGVQSGGDVAVNGILSRALWEATEIAGPDGATVGVEFRYAGPNGVLFTKRIEAVPGSWDLALTIAITSPETLPEGLEPGPRSFAMVAAGTVGVEVEDPFYQQPKAVAVGPATGRDMKLAKEAAELAPSRSDGALDAPGPLAALGGHNKYFAVLLRPADPGRQNALGSATWRRVDAWGPPNPDSDAEAAALGAAEPLGYILAEANLDLALPAAGETETWNWRLYAGPKDHGDFLALSPAHREIIDSDLSWFSGIGNFLIDVLVVLEGVAGNWGVAIILLTLCIRILLFPLNRRSQTAMARYQKKMQRVQPKLTAIKEKYSDDPQKLREAQARLMQEEGAFPPLGGCLPIFLQMPVFFGLFAALRTSFDLRHAGFAGWIQDLSRPDQLVYLGWNVPFIGLEYFNLLPILMVVLWIWQQRTMPQPTDEQAKQMQRIMLFMPVVMGLFLYNYAAGLSLYMMTQSGLGVFEQKIIKKVWPVDDTEPEKKKSGCAPFAEAMQRAAEQQKQQQRKLEQSKRNQGGAKKKRK